MTTHRFAERSSVSLEPWGSTLSFASSEEFLSAKLRDAVSCLVLDVRLPDRSGLDLQRELAAAQIPIPIIFITSHGDIRMGVQAIKAGAEELPPKPFRDQDLLDSIRAALNRDRVRRRRRSKTASCESDLNRSQLVKADSPWIVSGLYQANRLGDRDQRNHSESASGPTMRKMGATSLADLVRMAERLKIPLPNLDKPS